MDSEKWISISYLINFADIGSFSKFGLPCIWNDDYHPSDVAYEKYDSLQTYRYYAMWGAAILYLLGLVVFVICSIFGMVGCWRRSTKIVLTTALLMLFSGNTLTFFSFHAKFGNLTVTFAVTAVGLLHPPQL